MKKKFYITTPIYYVNSKPHLGTLYSTLIADVAARYNKLQGKATFFLTGTDEHGQKIETKAREMQMEPKAFVDSMIEPFKKVWQQYEIEYSKFIRTTDTDHIAAVQKLMSQLTEQGDIYTSVYTGLYCVPCETFVTNVSEEEKNVAGKQVCPNCKRDLQEISEESYFFRLSAYQDQLLDFYEENPDFVTPRERFQEVISFVKAGLKDLSFSRKTVRWGIPFPGDPAHTVYVWGDALTNYISAVGFGDTSASGAEAWKTWWPADVHVMAKDIVRFHAVYWPAMLMAAGIMLPKKLVVHGYVLIGDTKMSKSLGNAVPPEELAATFGVEQVRYYLMRQMPIGQDGHFDLKDLLQRVNADLSNSLGNLLNRIVVLANTNGLATVAAPEAWEASSARLRLQAREALATYVDEMNHYQFHKALSAVWQFIADVNAYVHTQKPWELARTNKELFAEVVSAVAHSLNTIGIMLLPIMPTKMTTLLAALGVVLTDETIDYLEQCRVSAWNNTYTLHTSSEPLFPRIEKTMEDIKPTTPVAAEVTVPKEAFERIAIDDFVKSHLVVGTITACVPVEKSEKLLQLTVDLGEYGVRTILSGVAKSFTPEQLINTQGVFVANLNPRKMAGIMSDGMMLFVSDGKDGLVRATVAAPVANGTRLT